MPFLIAKEKVAKFAWIWISGKVTALVLPHTCCHLPPLFLPSRKLGNVAQKKCRKWGRISIKESILRRNQQSFCSPRENIKVWCSGEITKSEICSQFLSGPISFMWPWRRLFSSDNQLQTNQFPKCLVEVKMLYTLNVIPITSCNIKWDPTRQKWENWAEN